MKNNKYVEYCSACGLCQAKGYADFSYKKGFLTPNIKTDDFGFFDKVCPVSGTAYKIQGEWGGYNSVYLGYSTDPDVRLKASSGGVITAISTYLLEEKKVDGIIHSGKDDEKPWRTKTYCSTTIEEINKRCGSRYSQSMPLADIFNLTSKDKKYAYIGKPCDVLALTNYFNIDPEFRKRFVCTISFFCAGAPSEKAQMELLEELKCSPDDCADLRYRGNGWPGYATAISKNGKETQMTYNESWGRILGRDIRKSCKFCMNGTGEPADISCGDAWYLNDDGTPDFTEGTGRNIVFGRSLVGADILRNAMEAGYVDLSDYSGEISEFKKAQKFQYERKATMLEKCLAMLIMFKKTPSYKYCDLCRVSRSSTGISFKRRCNIFLGTIKRIVKGKI
ncbi:MAG: hypothetical protein E7309_00670 [Butyrivibrio sp.]|jgi:coenzyme F420 hydrogenase subunit beta|nr:hypothetical protein [Butyrivibrio sp.]